MHPSETKPRLSHGSFCAAYPFSHACLLQSSQSRLKKFVMFDQSGGKGRIFIHPAVARDMFNLPPPSHDLGNRSSGTDEIALRPRESPRPSDVTEVNVKKLAYRQMVAAAFTSLQSARASRYRDLGAASASGQQNANVTPEVSSICLSGAKRSYGTASGSLHENTEDLDALLSADEDEDVRSTGHSPDELSQGESCEEEEGEEGSSKRRKIEGGIGAKEEMQEAARRWRMEERGSERRLKIKRTVKKLRSMIPGGSSLEAALVLDRIILYVKTLRDHVQQLETTRFQHPSGFS